MKIFRTENTKYVGVDPSPEISFSKYGFICKQEKADQYICVYKVSDDLYDYGFLCESEINDFLEVSHKNWMTKEHIDGFVRYIDKTKEEFLSLPFQFKAFAMIQYFGFSDIMGSSFDPMTLDDVIFLVNEEN